MRESVYLIIVISAKSAKLVLTAVGWELGLDGVSVKANLSFWELNDDGGFSKLLDLVLRVVLRLDLLSVNLDADLFVLELGNNLLFSTDNLDNHLIGVLLDLLGENGEILGDEGVAGGEWGLVKDIIESTDLVLLNLALGSGSLGELVLAGTLSDGWKMDTWDLGVLELNTLFWGLDGDVNVLTGKWLDGDLKDDAVFLVVLWAAGDGPVVVGLDKVEITGSDLLVFLGEFVLSNNVDLVKTGGLDQELVLWESVGLTLHVALVLLLFLGLLELSVDGDLVLLLGSPGRGEGKLNFTVWLFTELTEGRWHLWADGEKLGAESPFLGLLEDWRAANIHVPLAHTDLLVADGGELGVHVVVTWSFKLEGDSVLVSLLLLDVFDHLGEVLTTVLGLLLLELEFLLEHLVGLDVGEFSLLEWGDGKTGNEFSWAVLVLNGDLEVLLSEEPVLDGVLAEDVSTGGDLKSEEVVNLLDFLGLLLPLWDNDGSLLSLDVFVLGESWVTEEDDWAGGDGDDRLLVLWDDNLVDDLEVLLQSSDGLNLDWSVGTDGLEGLDSLLEEWSEHSHLVDVGGSNRWAGLNGPTEFGSFELKGNLSFGGSNSWDLSGDGHWKSKSGWELADDLVEVRSVVSLELVVLVEHTADLAELDLSVADELLNSVIDDLGVNWEDGVVHILVAKVDHGEGVLLVTGGWASTDVHLLGELLEKLDSGLNAASADNGGGFLLKRLELLESLVEVLVHVLLGKSDLGKVLVPVSSEDGVKGSMEVLWQDRALLEDSGEVELSSRVGVLNEEWKLSVGRGNHLLLWLVSGEGENLRALVGNTLVAWVGGLSELTDHLVGKSSNLLVRLLLHLRDDLDEEWFLWAGVHHSPESEHTNFWLKLTVLVDWEENLLDLAWHGVLEESEGIDGFLADWEWLALVNNDLVELVDGDVESSVSDGLEGQDLLVCGLSVLELLHEDTEELLLHLTLILTDEWADVLEVNDSTDDGSGGEPDGLANHLVGLSNTGFGKLEKGLSNALGGEWSLLDGLEELDSLEWSDVLVLDVNKKVLDGVSGSSDGKPSFNFTNLLVSLDVEGLVDLLELGGGGGAEDADKTGEEVSGLWHVILDLLDLLGDGLDQLDLLVKWELLEWGELSLVSILVEVLNKLFPTGRFNTDNTTNLLDVVLDGVVLLKGELRAGLGLQDFLSVDVDGVEGADLGLLKLFVLQNVGVDGGLGTLSALVEVDGLGDDGLLLLTDDGVGDLAVSLEGLLVGEERAVFLRGFLVIVRLKSLHLVSWGNWVEGDHVENGSLHVLGPLSVFLVELDLGDESISELGTNWELKHLLVLVRKLTLLQGVHSWHLLGLWEVGSGHADLNELEGNGTVIGRLNTDTGRNTGLGRFRGLRWESGENESIEFVVIVSLWLEIALESWRGGEGQGHKRGDDDRPHG